MMRANKKLRYVGCTACDVVSAGANTMAALSCVNDSEYVIFPGFCDVHVHFREPGFS